MDLDIDGNAAIVTASSRGLGRAAATALVREGVDVVINGRDPDRLEETAAALENEAPTGTVVIPHAGDITEASVPPALVDRAMNECGRLDHVVTSAGGPPSGPFLDIEIEAWYEAYELLVMSVVRLCHAAHPALEAGDGGTIVTITSRSVKEAIDSLVLSNAVRMGVIGLEKTLSKEFAPEIRANAVLPGVHRTGRIEELIEQAIERGDYESYDEGLADWSGHIPLDRLGDPMELGNTVAFLCSPRSGFINGAAIPIDGGGGRSNL